MYFLYKDDHGFRDKLFLWTTGRSRSVRRDMYGLLKDWDVGDTVIPGLRSAGLRRLDRTKLLQVLEASGVP